MGICLALLEDENNIKKPKLALFYYQIVVSTGTSCCVSLSFNQYGIVLADSKCIYVDHLFLAGVFGSIAFVFGLFICFFDQFSLFLDEVRVLWAIKFVEFVCDKWIFPRSPSPHGCDTLTCSKLELYDHLQLKGEW